MHITLLLVIAPSEAGKEGRRGGRADVLLGSITIKNKLKKKENGKEEPRKAGGRRRPFKEQTKSP